MNLYDISAELANLVDPDTGELCGYEAFQSLSMQRKKKIEETALWIKDLEGDAQKIKAEVEALQKRQKAIENRAKSLRRFLSLALDGEKFFTARCSMSFRRSKSLEVSDLSAAAGWLEDSGYKDLVVYGEPKIDKRAVKRLVDSGQNIPGVGVVEQSTLQIK